jgi:predicted  nucleic acid-binding Zn-ribbon protein
VKASREDQLKLLELQQTDTRILQLRAARKKHPAVKTMETLAGRKNDLKRAAITATSHANDDHRDVKRVEHDLERLISRQDVMSERLASGQGSHKDLQAMQHELNQMAQRRDVLENELLEVMDVWETAKNKVAELERQIEAVGADEEKAQAELKEAMGDVESELEEKLARRDELAGEIDDELIDEYEYSRERTGGLAVLEAKGRQIVGLTVSLPESEWHEIAMLPDDEVHLSETMDCIIVKTD